MEILQSWNMKQESGERHSKEDNISIFSWFSLPDVFGVNLSHTHSSVKPQEKAANRFNKQFNCMRLPRFARNDIRNLRCGGICRQLIKNWGQSPSPCVIARASRQSNLCVIARASRQSNLCVIASSAWQSHTEKWGLAPLLLHPPR